MQNTENLPAPKNMDFLVQIFLKLNLTQKEVSNRTGYSQQLISYWIKKDTCKYSSITDLFEKMGIKIECSYKLDNTAIQSSTEFEVQFNDIAVTNNRKNLIIEKYLEEDRPLKFVALLVKSTNLNLMKFCSEYGIDYTHMYHCLTTDYIRIDQIYEIARKTNKKVEWKLSPLKS